MAGHLKTRGSRQSDEFLLQRRRMLKVGSTGLLGGLSLPLLLQLQT